MDVTIKQLAEADWLAFSQIRLKALLTDPKVFGSNYELESKSTEAEWRERLQATRNAIFMVYENDDPIGVTAVGIDREDPTGKTALLWGTWLAPAARRKGLSELLYKTRIDWARQQPAVEKIVVSHRESNLASKKANQKHGFVFTHIEEKTWTDGGIEDEVFYELKIKR
jgi:RimJ/RimL family protein N-acetyltransferase